MNKVLIYFFLVVNAAFGHQPDLSSTMLIEKADGQWVLQVRSALTALEYEVKYSESENEYETPEEFQQLVIDHIKDNIKISFNKQAVTLDGGVVNLGHETSVVFILEGLHNTIDEIDITHTSFSKINRNKSLLIIMKDSLKPQQFVLDSKNGHQAQLYIQNGKFENRIKSDSLPMTPAHTPSWRWPMVGLVFLLFFGVLGYRFLYCKKNSL